MRRVGRGYLCHDQDIGYGIHPSATVFLGYFDSHEAQLGSLGDGFARKFTAFIELRCNRRDFTLCKVARSILDHLLFFGKRKVHVIVLR